MNNPRIQHISNESLINKFEAIYRSMAIVSDNQGRNVATGDYINFSGEKFYQSRTPAMLVRGFGMYLPFLILENGYFAMINARGVDRELGVLKLQSDNVFAEFLHASSSNAWREKPFPLMEAYKTYTAAQETLGKPASKSLFLHSSKFDFLDVLGINLAAQQKLSQNQNPCTSKAEALRGKIEAINKALDDSFLYFKGTTQVQNWQDEDEDKISSLVRECCLGLDIGRDIGVYASCAQKGYQFNVTIDWHDASDAVIHRIQAYLGHDYQEESFQGFSYEYNDGAIDQESGYDEGPAILAYLTIEKTSHDRMSAMKAFYARLKHLGLDKENFTDLHQDLCWHKE